MPIDVATPDVGGLAVAVEALREWQSEGAPMQLHPGDLGWFYRFGEAATSAAVRIWSRNGHVLAVGLLDGADVLRLTMTPTMLDDLELAIALARDIRDPARGVLPAGRVNVEVPASALLQTALAEAGWDRDEPWTPLHRDLTQPVEESAMRVEEVAPSLIADRVAIQRASFPTSTFTTRGWRDLSAGLPFADARDLLGFDGLGTPVAAITVWSAGPGRPGLIEPMGVHRDHRGAGYGRAITLAGSAALRELGSSSAIVCTPSSNLGAVATYRSAGFEAWPEVRDRFRDVGVTTGVGVADGTATG